MEIFDLNDLNVYPFEERNKKVNILIEENEYEL